MLTGRSIRGKNFLETESAGVVTRLGRVAGFIVETTNVHLHPTLLQTFRQTESGHTSAQVAHWADKQDSNNFSIVRGEHAILCPKCNIVRMGNMVWNLPESRHRHKLPRKIEDISINIFLLHLRFRANGPFSDVIPIRAFPSLFGHKGKVFIIRQKLVIGMRFWGLFIERLLDQCLRRLRRENVALIR